MRITGFVCVLFAAGAAFGAEPRADDAARQPSYVEETFGLKAVGKAVFHGAIGQTLGRPKEWGRGVSGFGKRTASGFGTRVVRNSIAYPLAYIRHEDLLYHPMEEGSTGARLRHALVSTVVTNKTTTGEKTFASGKVAGTLGASVVSRAWQPAAARSVAGGLTSGGISLGVDAGTNVLREFWPRHKNIKRIPIEPVVAPR